MRPECEFEAEILAAVIESCWPHSADAALHEHAASCAVCSEAVLVASALAEDRAMMRDSAHIPEPGRVWWLAQVRARREAVATAGRPSPLFKCVYLHARLAYSARVSGLHRVGSNPW